MTTMESVGKYTILRKLGKGGMGSVYKASVPVIDKVVAVKILDPFEAMEELVGHDNLKKIFLAEATTMADLRHPAVLSIWDFDEDEQGRPFFVMEFICNNLGNIIGESFEMEKRSRCIQADKVLHYGRQLLEGLSYLHHRGIIHRDIKPYNIMVSDEDRIKICDFGMALVNGVSFSGPEMMQIGSPYYAAPEQNSNPNKVDGRSDLYSAGVLLYRMLTGELPSMRSFSLSMVNRLFDSSWDAFFARALNLQPDGRFQTAREMLQALEELHIHWQDVKKEGPSREDTPAKNNEISLRHLPVNACGNRARKLFGLNELFHPQKKNRGQLVPERGALLRDPSTNLTWQGTTSQYAMSWKEAQAHIQELNTLRHGDRDTWRLPTVDELFSLNLDSRDPQQGPQAAPRGTCLWSADSHGKRDAWYVNLELGYTDWQDINCRNFVRGVCSNP